MNVAFGIWTLLIGGVTLPEISSTVTPFNASPAVQDSPEPLPGGSYAPRSSPTYAPRSSQSVAPRRTRSSYGGGQAPMRQQQMRMPLAPTDPAAGRAAYPWGSPTSQLNPLLQPFGGSSFGNLSAGQDLFSSPYARRPTTMTGPALLRPAATHGSGIGTTGSNVRKPYADYRRPSIVSPYINLTRDDTDFGRIDNYNTLVRPKLEQQNANRRAAGQIRGLQNNSRQQGSAIQRIGNRTGSLPQTTSGQFFMNTQKYFPGSGR